MGCDVTRQLFCIILWYLVFLLFVEKLFTSALEDWVPPQYFLGRVLFVFPGVLALLKGLLWGCVLQNIVLRDYNQAGWSFMFVLRKCAFVLALQRGS